MLFSGSGKTVVAAHICKEYIAKHSSPRILFLVPRVPLVQQQYGVFSRYCELIFRSSGSILPRRQHNKEYDKIKKI